MKCILFVLALLLAGFCRVQAQQSDSIQTRSSFRINVYNPSIQFEQPTGTNSLLTLSGGIAFSGSVEGVLYNFTDYGLKYMLTPFCRLVYKRFYNLKKVALMCGEPNYNTGDFIGFRCFTRFMSIDDDDESADHADINLGPVWGVERNYGRLALEFEIGPGYSVGIHRHSGSFMFLYDLIVGVDLSHHHARRMHHWHRHPQS